MNLHWKLARVSAVVLLLLAASPYTAPFAVCDLTDGSHSATRHLTHASAVLRPAAKVARHPIVLGAAIASLVVLHHQAAVYRRPAASQPPLPATHLVLRL